MSRHLTILLFSVFTVLAASARTPVVGIADICKTNAFAMVPVNYVKAVEAAGAIPYVLPVTADAAAIAASLDGIDLLLLCGGEDVEPQRYGETDRIGLKNVNLRRDAWELALLDEAIRRRLPILGVCRGCQIMNVRFGGSLWQDIPSEIKGAAVHLIKGEHALSVEPGTILAKIAGTCETTVNSRHHQSVRRVAGGFRVAARSPDGVIEAIEGVDYPAVGVQFHPEKLFADKGRRDFLPLFRGDWTRHVPVRGVNSRRAGAGGR